MKALSPNALQNYPAYRNFYPLPVKKFFCNFFSFHKKESHSVLRVLHCQYVSCQAWQSYIERVVQSKDLLEIGGDGLGLDSQSPVCCYGNAAPPHHGHYGRPVVLHYGLGGLKERGREGERGGKRGRDESINT